MNSSFKFEATSRYTISGYKWCPTSIVDIEKSEDSILKYIKCKFNKFFVNIGANINLWTIACYPDNENVVRKYIQRPNTHNSNSFQDNETSKTASDLHSENTGNSITTNGQVQEHHNIDHQINFISPTPQSDINNYPLVLVHGFCAGIAFWVKNLDALAPYRKVYAFDLLGFGRSSRIQFSTCPIKAENQFVTSIEKWRQKLNIDSMILCGHSFGGYLAMAYALKYPDAVKHLILCDPWGFPEKSAAETARKPVHTHLPIWIKFTASLLQPFNPLALMRLAGPWGPGLVEKMRPDLPRKFSDVMGDTDSLLFSQYIYHCNAQNPTGESAFSTMTIPFGWAKNPMIKRVNELRADIPMTIIYGSRSWMDSSTGFQIKYLRPGSYVDVKILNGAGHHVYADKAKEFNHIINCICQKIDENRLRLNK